MGLVELPFGYKIYFCDVCHKGKICKDKRCVNGWKKIESNLICPKHKDEEEAIMQLVLNNEYIGYKNKYSFGEFIRYLLFDHIALFSMLFISLIVILCYLNC